MAPAARVRRAALSRGAVTRCSIHQVSQSSPTTTYNTGVPNAADVTATGHLFGASGRHARVVVVTVTDKEFPIARAVFSRCGPLVEIDDLSAYTCEQYLHNTTLPFVLVRTTDRGNLAIADDVTEWVRLFRPQAFVVVGTAGGVWRPDDAARRAWSGRPRGDVVLSEYVHFSDYRKVSAGGSLMRHHRLEQPAAQLLRDARAIAADDKWHEHLGENWVMAPRRPKATEQEVLVGEQIQDDPLDSTQQFLMKTFDRAAAVEMESAGVAQTLHSLRRDPTYAPLYLSVRGISDLIWACGTDGELNPGDLVTAAEFYDSKHRDAASDGDVGHKPAGDSPEPVPGNGLDEHPSASGKTAERALWSPRAAEAASAFALALVQRLVRKRIRPMHGHPEIEPIILKTVGAGD
jgi:nucleoside phosphorylase